MLCRFWTNNRNGHCLASTCEGVSGTLEHLLAVCPALEHIRHRLHSLWCLKTVDCPPLHSLILKILGSAPATQVRFILDSTASPDLLSLTQMHGPEIMDRVLYLTRTWAFSIHKHKLMLLGRWPEFKNNRIIKYKTDSPQSEPSMPPPTTDPLSESSTHVTVAFNLPNTNTTIISGCGLPAAQLHRQVQKGLDDVPVQPGNVPPVLHHDQPPVIPVPTTSNCDSQPANAAVVWDSGMCGCGEGDAVAAYCLGGGASGGQPVSAINLLFSSSLQANQCRQAGKVPGMG